MENKNIFTDLHCHTALKPTFNSEKTPNMWVFSDNPHPDEFLHFFNLFKRLGLRKMHDTFASYTQTNLEACAKGNLRLLVITLYPIERGYVSRKSFGSILTAFLTLFVKGGKWYSYTSKKLALLKAVIQSLVGISPAKIDEMWHEQRRRRNYVDYYADYKKELGYTINAQQTRSTDSKYASQQFKLVNNWEEYKTSKANNVICGIITAEGVHSFGEYRVKHLFSRRSVDGLNTSNQKRFKETMVANIADAKTSNYPPFFITMSHHFNNLVSGHCKSFTFPMTAFFNQKGGRNRGLSQFGKELITQHLLQRNPRRILIDVKHMSIKTRLEYYQIVRHMQNEGDSVPIIWSHSAINGFKDMRSASRARDNKKLNKHSYISRWDVNMTDTDILETFDSDGLIGILMHDGRMPGKVFTDRFKKAKTKAEQNKLHVQMFLTNVYHIVRVIHEQRGQNGWKIITLGSDADGIVDPFDNFNTADKLPKFQNCVWEYLKGYEQLQSDIRIVDVYNQDKKLSITKFQELNQGMSPEQITEAIFSKNLENFLAKYFTEEYLTGTAAT